MCFVCTGRRLSRLYPEAASHANGTPAVNVLANLAKCRCWDGYSLADVGPFNDGTMPDYFYGLCEVMGDWMEKNRESLLGVEGGPWPGQVDVPVNTEDNGKRLDYRMDGKTLTFTVPADRTTPLLDVIKVQW